MAKINHRVSLAFTQLSDGSLNDFSNSICTGLEANTGLFPSPTVPVLELRQRTETFSASVVAAANGGRLATAEKNEARAQLLAALRQDAAYVQSLMGTNLPGLLASGFLAVSSNTTPAPLPKPVVENIDNIQSTKLMMRLKPLRNYRAIEARRKLQSAPAYEAAGIFTQARRIEQEGLIPGAIYDFQFRAVGGSTGYSDWSDPISHMAT